MRAPLMARQWIAHGWRLVKRARPDDRGTRIAQDGDVV